MIGWWLAPAGIMVLCLARIAWAFRQEPYPDRARDIAEPLSISVNCWALYLIYLCVAGHLS